MATIPSSHSHSLSRALYPTRRPLEEGDLVIVYLSQTDRARSHSPRLRVMFVDLEDGTFDAAPISSKDSLLALTRYPLEDIAAVTYPLPVGSPLRIAHDEEYIRVHGDPITRITPEARKELERRAKQAQADEKAALKKGVTLS